MTHPTPQPEPHTPDPALDALLDEALAPGQPPEGLGERIVAATAGRVAARRRPVVARLGGGIPHPALRIAAAVLIAAGLIGLIYLNTRPAPADPPALAQLEQLNLAADASHQQAEPIDLQIEAFALQVTLADRTDPWAEPDEAFDELTIESQMDLLATDFERVF